MNVSDQQRTKVQNALHDTCNTEANAKLYGQIASAAQGSSLNRDNCILCNMGYTPTD